MIKVVIADDHQVMLDGLKAILEKDENMEIVGEAINGKGVLRLLDTRHANIAILDIKMPEMNGIELTKHITELYPHIKIIILTMYKDKEFIMAALDAGAHGYVLKNKGQSELIKAINAVNDGNKYFPKEIVDIIIHERSNPKPEVLLTKREIAVLKLIVDGMKTIDIAERLHIAITTVNAHRRNLLSKTKAKNVADLIRYAIKNKIVEI